MFSRAASHRSRALGNIAPLFAFLTFVCALAWSRPASAYAWMIRHEYNGCNQCHADPSGGGLLTPYGRAQGVLLLATKYTGGGEDEDPGKIGDFLFGAVPLPEQLLLGGDVRYLHLIEKPKGSNAFARDILMQSDFEGQLAIDRFRVNGSLGYASSNNARYASVTRGQGKRLISRVLWAGVDLGKDREFLLRVGRMNMPFGVRSIEHEMKVHKLTRTDINDSQQHGVALAYNSEKFRGELMAIAGNFQLRPDDLRERGYSGYFEFDGVNRLGLGISSLITHAKVDRDTGFETIRHAHGAFVRYAPVKQLAILSEADALFRSEKDNENRWGFASNLQADVEPLQGLHLIGTGELWNEGLSGRQKPSSSYALWGSLAWFFLPHIDGRMDVVWESQGTTGPRADITLFLWQVHAYL